MNLESYLKLPLPFEREIDRYFNSKDRLTIFEIGACEGEDTVKLRKKFPNAKIYAFEPLPANIKIIKKTYEHYSVESISLFEIALSEKNGSSEFFVSSGQPEEIKRTKDWDYGNKSSSLLAPKETKNVHKWLKFNQKIKVSTQRLDTFCKKNHIENINFIYMDVQGAELMVLRGAGDILTKIDAIWMEVEAVELYDKQPLKTEVEEFMQSSGFVCIKSTVDSISGDQLYIRNDLFNKKNKIINSVINALSKLVRP